MIRRTRLVVAAALVAAVAVLSVTGCGSGTTEISPSAAEDLDAAVGEVRAAVEAGDTARARELLTMLRTTVVELATSGAVTGDRALEINRAIETLDERLSQSAPSTTQAPTTTEAPATTTEAPPVTEASSISDAERGDEKPGKGDDRGPPKGRGDKDDENDEDD